MDSDGDGLPDDWETSNGLDKNNPTDAELDSDNDGLSNLEEYRAGTNPRDSTSSVALKISSLLGQTGHEVILRFTAIQGHSYSILYSDSVEAVDWKKVGSVEFTPTTGEVEVRDPNPNFDGPRFYRLITPMRP